jgi:hypothetical protein
MMSRPDGFYTIYGVRGPIQIETKRDGYSTGIHAIDVTSHTSRNLTIVPTRGRPDYSGTYELRVSVKPPCQGGGGSLPEAARQRAYTATVVQDEGRLLVRLAGANFEVVNGHGQSFLGFVDPAGAVTFNLGGAGLYYYYYLGEFEIAERIDDVVLMISGKVNTVGTPQRLAGSLEGLFITTHSPTKPIPLAQCRGTHGFELVRRSS